jgi:hypothetical protein
MRMSYFLFGLAAIVLALGGWGAVNGALTLRWPRAAAEIVDANLKLHEREVREAYRVDGRSSRTDRRHTFSVNYLYQVDGRTYLGDRTEPYDFGMQNSAGAVSMAKAYRIGSTVQVAYDPADPGIAYLVPGPSSFSLILMGIGVALGLFGLLARRMIRVGPGEDGDERPKTPKQGRARDALDPEIASYYRKPTGTQPPP